VKALAHAHRWKRVLESRQYARLTEHAEAEKINRSYLSRVLRLTLLGQDIVELILDGRQGDWVTLPSLMERLPLVWHGQRYVLAKDLDDARLLIAQSCTIFILR
jgi:hypothetical protein